MVWSTYLLLRGMFVDVLLVQSLSYILFKKKKKQFLCLEHHCVDCRRSNNKNKVHLCNLPAVTGVSDLILAKRSSFKVLLMLPDKFKL